MTGGVEGATLTLYADGQAIGNATVTANDSTTQITTNGNLPLAGDSQYQITVQQSLPNQTVSSSPWSYNDGTAVTVSGGMSTAFIFR